MVFGTYLSIEGASELLDGWCEYDDVVEQVLAVLLQLQARIISNLQVVKLDIHVHGGCLSVIFLSEKFTFDSGCLYFPVDKTVNVCV